MIKLTLLFIVFALQGCVFPSDEALEARFHSNRPDFVTLARMLDEDKGIAVLDDDNIFYGADIDTTISAERLAVYRGLLQKLNLEGIARDHDGSVNLTALYKGFPIRSSGKGYYYSTANVAPIVDSLDSVIRNDRGDTRPTFKKIEKNWYLFYESW